jgi:neutral ceramidase
MLSKAYCSVLAILFILHSHNSFAQQNALKAAVVAFDLKPAVGIPLAGYGAKERRLAQPDWFNEHLHSFLFKPSEGERDPIRSKVMILSNEAQQKELIFISLDLIGVDQRFVRDLSSKLQPFNIHIDQLFVTATHTHSGPGTLSRNPALCAIATDLYKKKNYWQILEHVAQNVIEARNQLRPAKLYHTSFQAQDIQVNKWRHPGEEYFDKTANILMAESLEGEWLGAMVNFAMHGNAMPIGDLRYSADILGAIERNLEETLWQMNKLAGDRPAVLFMNGAQGDVKHKGIRDENLMESLAADFNQQAKVAMEPKNLKPIAEDLSYTREKVFIGVPFYPLKTCSPQKKQSLLKNWIEKKSSLLSKFKVNIPLYPIFPLSTYLSTAKVGEILMMTWPGEPSTALGWELKNIARKYSNHIPWVLGLTNDYLTYFTTEEEFFEAAYDSCSSMYGYKGGERILKYYDLKLKDL